MLQRLYFLCMARQQKRELDSTLFFVCLCDPRRESRALEKRRISKNLFRRMVQARQGQSDNHFHYERHNTVLNNDTRNR